MIRHAHSGDWIGTFQGHKGAVWSAKLDPTGNLAATASGDFSVVLWDAITGSLLTTLVHGHIVKSVDFSPDSQRLCSGGHEGIVRVYDLVKVLNHTSGGGGDKEENRRPQVSIPQMEKGEKKIVITKCLWINQDIILVAASDGKVRCWNVPFQNRSSNSDGESNPPFLLLHTLSVEAEVRDMELTTNPDPNTKNARSILTVAAGTTVSFFELLLRSPNTTTTSSSSSPILTSTLLKAHKLPIHFQEEGGASLHPSGRKFIAGGSDLWVRVFDFESGEELECNKGHHGPVRCLRYAPNGETYATGSEDGTIRLWKTDP